MTNEHDDNLADRYLNRQMDAAETTAFEIRMLDEPELLERVQLIEAMKQALHEHRLSGSGLQGDGLEREPDESRITPIQTAKILPFTGWLRQPLSMAASLLLAVMVLQQFMPGQGSSESMSTPIGTVLLLENSRGIVPAEFRGPPPYLFQIDVGLGNQADSFKVSLRNDSNAEVLVMDDLQADTDGWIRLVVDQALAGNYQIELAWRDAQGAAQGRSFPLQVSN